MTPVILSLTDREADYLWGVLYAVADPFPSIDESARRDERTRRNIVDKINEGYR